MPHPVGERLRCDDCGAEIMFVKPCTCPERERKSHSDVCCGKEMRNLGVVAEAEPPRAGASH